MALLNVSESEEVLSKANDFQALGLKSKDSLHLACSAVTECDFFFTTDDDILKKKEQITGVKVLSPVGYIIEYFK